MTPHPHFFLRLGKFVLIGLLPAISLAATELVSRPAFSDVQPSNGTSLNAQGSDGLRYVVFESSASNLVSGDHNGHFDIILRDPLGEARVLSKVGDNWGNGDSSTPDISADGQWVVFASAADNLVPDDHNGVEDLFVFRNGINGLRRLQPASTETNGRSFAPKMSASGQRIVFISEASNWIEGDHNGLADAFVLDLQTNDVRRFSYALDGTEVTDLPPVDLDISWDGRCASVETTSTQFAAADTNAGPDYYVFDLDEPTPPWRGSVGPGGLDFEQYSPGRHVLIACHDLVFNTYSSLGANSEWPAGLYRNQDGNVSRLPLPLVTGSRIETALSSNGRYLVTGVDIASNSSVALQILDLSTGQVVQSSSHFGRPTAVSDDGQRVLVDTVVATADADRNVMADVVRHSLGLAPEWLSRSMADLPAVSAANGASGMGAGVYRNDQTIARRHHAISADGRMVLFSSLASNLVEGDTNGVEDVFIRDIRRQVTTRVSYRSGGAQTIAASAAADLSADGNVAVFESCDTMNLIEENGICHIFAADFAAGTVEAIDINAAGAPSDRPGLLSGMWPRVSGDGRYVVFANNAANLIIGGTSSTFRVYIRDRHLQTTTLLGQGVRPSISQNGRFVVWAGGPPDQHPMLWDRESGEAVPVPLRASGTKDDGYFPDYLSISDSGQYLAFGTYANGLVPGDEDDGTDVFVYDRQTQTSVLISGTTGAAANVGSGLFSEISADGRLVAYIAESTLEQNHQEGVLVDWQLGVSRSFAGPELLEPLRNGVSRPRFSEDGAHLVFAASELKDQTLDQTGRMYDVYVTDTEVVGIHQSGFED